ncbi:unnamed protein product [Calypogeia fissa]
MTGFGGAPPVYNNTIYVCNLPPGSDDELLAEHFGQLGLLKKDKRTGRPKIWIYRDKVSNEPKGDATVSYEDPHAASAAVDWFNNTEFHGSRINVSIAESKREKEQAEVAPVMEEPDPPVQDEDQALEFGTDGDMAGDGAGGGRGRGRGDAGAKAWQQEGDWPCPNPSCANINFAFRGVCNRCGTARPSGGAGGGGGAGSGRGRGRGAPDAARGRGPGGPPGLFGPNDWNCPMCGNINWAKRTKCNICNTTKPGHNEGGVREGRAGGYKEFDEAEIEETRRRRKELEEDDGEMYDEFGTLKKKFRLKAKLGDTAAPTAIPGVGKAAWDKEELGIVERSGSKEKSRERSLKENDWDEDGSRSWRDRSDGDRNGNRSSRDEDRSLNDYDKSRGRGDRTREYSDRGRDVDRDTYRERERSRDRGRDRGRDYDRERDREWDRPRDRERVRERDRFLD